MDTGAGTGEAVSCRSAVDHSNLESDGGKAGTVPEHPQPTVSAQQHQSHLWRGFPSCMGTLGAPMGCTSPWLALSW